MIGPGIKNAYAKNAIAGKFGRHTVNPYDLSPLISVSGLSLSGSCLNRLAVPSRFKCFYESCIMALYLPGVIPNDDLNVV